MPNSARLLILFLCATALSSPVFAKEYTVLIVGNSYAAQTWTYVRDFFAADPDHSISITRMTPGGRQLHEHMGDAATRALISTEGPWDCVIFQEQSQIPAFAAFSSGWWTTFYTDGALPLTELAQNAGAKVLYFQTWARAAGDTDTLQYFNNDPLVMQDALSSSYGEAARLTGAIVLPVGEAWEDALAANAGLGLHSGDRSHPNANGGFLTGAVFFASITGKDVRNSSYTASLTTPNADFLKSIAHYVTYEAWADQFPGLTDRSPSADSDGDGMSNEAEWMANTNPTAPSARLVVSLYPVNGQLMAQYQSAADRIYQLETKSHPDAAWVRLTPMDGSGTMQEQAISEPVEPGGWIRLGVERKPL